MKKAFFSITTAFIVASCVQQNPVPVSLEQPSSDQIFQYSLFTALANKVYDGNLTVGELTEKGDLGLGTFNMLNGEMIVLDGIVYHLFSDGSIKQADDNELVPFTVVTFFDNDKEVDLKDVSNYDSLKVRLMQEFSSLNNLYAFRIKGDFKHIKCGSAEEQVKPYSKTLSKALADRPVYEAENISGTMVGFWFPEYIGRINVVGFHLHFISDDKSIAGHVMEFQSANLVAGIDYSSELQMVLPETEEFKDIFFDLSEGYN